MVGGTVLVNSVESTEATTHIHGTQVTATAIPRAGYTFARWNGASTSTSPNITINMDSHKALFAVFEPQWYTLDISIPQDGGRVSRSPDQRLYAYGTEVTVTATTVTDGYRFALWNGASTSTSSNITVTMDDSKTLLAIFELQRRTLMINPSSTIGGTVTVNGTTSTGNTAHNHGAQVIVTANPEEGYAFTGWTGASTSTARQVGITMDSDKELTANFVQIPGGNFTIETIVTPPNGGSVLYDPPGGSYATGTTLIATATPAEGHTFTGWSSGGLMISDPSMQVTINNNLTLTAEFLINTYTLTTDVAPTIGGNTVSANNGTPIMSGATPHNHGTPIEIRANAANGYRFVNWTVGGAVNFVNGSINSVDPIVSLSSDATIRANFQRTYTLTITRNLAGGTVFVDNLPSTEPTTHDSGAVVNLRADIANGYRFINWTVDGAVSFVSGNANSTNPTIRLNSNATIRANFELIRYTLTIDRNLAGGTVSINGTTYTMPTIYDFFNREVNISTSLNDGFRFINWTVTSGTANIANPTSRHDAKVILNSDATIRANFAERRRIDTTFSFRTGAYNYTLPNNVTFPATIEIYAAGGGGGGQGGHSADACRNSIWPPMVCVYEGWMGSGTGGSGGGGGVANWSFDVIESATFNIAVGSGGGGGATFHASTGTSSRWGGNGGDGAPTIVTWVRSGGNIVLTAGGGRGGNGGNGGNRGEVSVNPATTPITLAHGSSGIGGNWDSRLGGTGGGAGITRIGFVNPFPSGSVGRGGDGGYATSSRSDDGNHRTSSAGSNGQVRIIVTYYR
ncbi:MAG: InlB B-repeat-containing protein [Chitinispirillales bacterium]|jgi:uncharacterized repeat protein (TIGR02543 family)|nr:InlB B-repeat-containing protein [Chitinispirillales bacterium]